MALDDVVDVIDKQCTNTDHSDAQCLSQCCSGCHTFLKNSQLNPEANTGHIEKIKHAPERYNSQLSNAPGNVKNGE
jgi:hypothetical protein